MSVLAFEPVKNAFYNCVIHGLVMHVYMHKRGQWVATDVAAFFSIPPKAALSGADFPAHDGLTVFHLCIETAWMQAQAHTLSGSGQTHTSVTIRQGYAALVNHGPVTWPVA